MAGPYDAESTIREQSIYKIDHDITDDESEAETMEHVAAQPVPVPSGRPQASPLATTAGPTTGAVQQSPFARSVNVQRDFEIEVDVESEKPQKLRQTLPMLPPIRR